MMNRTFDPATRIFTLEQALQFREGLRKERKRLVVTNGCFDILHRGHASYLAVARELGDALIVLLNSDDSVRALKGPTRPVNDQASRAFVLAALRAVDGVLIFQGDRCDRGLEALAPDVYVKAGDYRLEKLDPGERGALEKVGSRIVFLPFVAGFSTTSTIAKLASPPVK